MGAASEGRQRRPWRWWLLTACAAASAAGCAPTVGAASHTVAGKVTVGPQCGGPQREGQSCDVDYEGVEVRLLDEQGHSLATARTDAQGSFRLAGPAGRHSVRVVSPKIVRCPEPSVVLPQVGSATVSIACDSGRR